MCLYNQAWTTDNTLSNTLSKTYNQPWTDTEVQRLGDSEATVGGNDQRLRSCSPPASGEGEAAGYSVGGEATVEPSNGSKLCPGGGRQGADGRPGREQEQPVARALTMQVLTLSYSLSLSLPLSLSLCLPSLSLPPRSLSVCPQLRTRCRPRSAGAWLLRPLLAVVWRKGVCSIQGMRRR